MKKDSKKVLYESIMTSIVKEVKKALNESLITDIEEIKDIISDWASDNMNTSGWDNYDSYCDAMEAMMDHGNDMLVDYCYDDITKEYEFALDEDQLKDIIDEVLAEEAKYYYDTADSDDFDNEDDDDRYYDEDDEDVEDDYYNEDDE